MEYRQIKREDYRALSDYYTRNTNHFKKWQPRIPYDFHSEKNWESRIDEYLEQQDKGVFFYFVAIEESQIYGHCTLSQLVRGAFQACYMGYGVCHNCEGKGIAFQLTSSAINFAFSELKLNRIMANYIPHNNRSAKLLNYLGFTREGVARNYLKINGKWEDHVLTSLHNPENSL